MQRIPDSILAGWRAFPPLARTILAIAVLVTATAAALLWRQPSPGAMVDLLDVPVDQWLARRIRLALVERGIGTCQVSGSHVLVPADQQTACLQALRDSGVLPRGLLASGETGLPTANPFLPRSLQELSQQQFRERQLRQLLDSLPFVAESMVQIDSRPARSAFDPPDLRCVVSIRPHGRLVLDGQQLGVVLRNVETALAGIDPDQIVINDLNAGLAWDRRSLQDPQLLASRIGSLRMVRQCEHCLEAALCDWTGVTLAVQAGCLAAGPAGCPPAMTALPEGTAGSCLAAGSNQPVRVPAILPNQTSPAEQAVSPAGTAGRTTPAAPLPPPPEIRLTVSREALHRYLARPRGSVLAPAGGGAAAGMAPDSPENRERMRDELTGIVRQCLAEVTRETGCQPEIRVEFPVGMESGLPASAPASMAHWWTHAHGTASAAVAGSLLLGLLLVSTFRRRDRTAEPAPAPPSPEVWFDNSVDGTRRDQIRREINDLLDRNPDAAARVIQTWIRDAA